jgi:hypothetical protein
MPNGFRMKSNAELSPYQKKIESIDNVILCVAEAELMVRHIGSSVVPEDAGTQPAAVEPSAAEASAVEASAVEPVAGETSSRRRTPWKHRRDKARGESKRPPRHRIDKSP